jgi:hypothetical protein
MIRNQGCEYDCMSMGILELGEPWCCTASALRMKSKIRLGSDKYFCDRWLQVLDNLHLIAVEFDLLIDRRNRNMATRYAFSQTLKELRFHLCQTSEHSAALRYKSSNF